MEMVCHSDADAFGPLRHPQASRAVAQCGKSESNAHANGPSQIVGSKSASDGAEIVLPVAEQRGAIAATTLAVQQDRTCFSSGENCVARQ